MGRSCPSQSAHPFGGKTKLMILTSERNGSAILTLPLVWTWIGRQSRGARGERTATAEADLAATGAGWRVALGIPGRFRVRDESLHPEEAAGAGYPRAERRYGRRIPCDRVGPHVDAKGIRVAGIGRG